MFGCNKYRDYWVSVLLSVLIMLAGLSQASSLGTQLRVNLQGIFLLKSIELHGVENTWFELPPVQPEMRWRLLAFSPGNRIGDTAILLAGGCGWAKQDWELLTSWGKIRRLAACRGLFPPNLFHELFAEPQLRALVTDRAKRLQAKKEFMELIEFNEWAVHIFPASSQLWYRLGYAYFRTGQYDRAQSALANSLGLGGGGHYMLAKIFFEKGNIQAAFEHVLASVQLQEWTSSISGRWLTFAYIAQAAGNQECANYCACQRVWEKKGEIDGGSVERLQDHLGLPRDAEVCQRLLHLDVRDVCAHAGLTE